MHIIYFVGLIVTLAAISAGLSQNDTHNEHSYWQSFNQIHREPLLATIKNRDALAEVEEKWITQKLDHLNETDTRTWQMRYLEMNEFHVLGGPMFIFVGAEWKITEDNLQAGHIYDMVQENNGIFFYTEHRFYGDSRPLNDLTVESLQYLHTRQALADLAHFIRTIKATYVGMRNAKVFLSGGAHSASMVTWFKHDYPDLADGVWASSAPLIAKVDFFEYKEYEAQMIRKLGGEACYNAIDNASREYEQMFAQNRDAEVKAMLKICNDFDASNDLDLWTFFSSISNIFTGVAQSQTAHNNRIPTVCRYIMSAESPAVGLAKFLLLIWGRNACNDLSYNGLVKGISYTEYSNAIMRQAIYQQCTSTGWFYTSGTRQQPYGVFPVQQMLQLCYDTFGLTSEHIYAEVAKTEQHYGGINPGVENVYFTHGEIDPCRVMGIQDPAQATIIPNYSHCSDFGSISPEDTPEMLASKTKLAELVRQIVAK